MNTLTSKIKLIKSVNWNNIAVQAVSTIKNISNRKVSTHDTMIVISKQLTSKELAITINNVATLSHITANNPLATLLKGNSLNLRVYGKEMIFDHQTLNRIMGEKRVVAIVSDTYHALHDGKEIISNIKRSNALKTVVIKTNK